MVPHALRDERFRAGTEFAWPAPLAVAAATSLADRGLAVVAIEVWLAVKPAPVLSRHSIYRWEAGAPSPGETWDQYARTAAQQAVGYIRTFQWAKDDTESRSFAPHFCFVVAEGPQDLD
jgi:hypothetical protein